MKAEFDVQLQQKDLFRFNMYHSYHRVNTWLFTILGIVIFVLSFTTINDIDPTYVMMYWFCSLVFVFFTPINLWTTTKLRMKEDSPLRQKLHYTFSETGIEVYAVNEEGEGEPQGQKVDWSQIYRVVETKHQVLVYTSRINASILPKEQISRMDNLKDVLSKQMPSHRLKLKK